MELRSLSPVLDGPLQRHATDARGPALPRTNSRCLSGAASQTRRSSHERRGSVRCSLRIPASRWLGAMDRLALQRGASSCLTCAGTAEAAGASLFSDASACHPRRVGSSKRPLRASLFSDAFAKSKRSWWVPPCLASALPCSRWHGRAGVGWAVLTTVGETTRPSNKGMKQTKPSILELRSLSPVLGGPWRRRSRARCTAYVDGPQLSCSS